MVCPEDRALRVLFATQHTYLPQRTGGAESSTHDLCRALLAQGHEPMVLASLRPHTPLWAVNRLRVRLDRAMPCPADGIMGYPVHRGWFLARGLETILAREAVDAVVATFDAAAVLPVALAQGVPAVLYLRDDEFRRLRLLEKAGLAAEGHLTEAGRSVRYVANSAYVARAFLATFGVLPATIPPLIDLARYRAAGPRDSVLSLCLHPLKGDDVAFRIAARCPHLPFVFRQSWPLPRAQWAAYAARARASGNVRLLRPTLDASRVYAGARILLVPSRWNEGYGRVVAEAQSNGVPVIATDVGGLPESVGPGGVLVPHDAPVEAWEQALRRLWDDPAHYQALSQAALRHAHRPEVSAGTLVGRLLDVLAPARERASA